jgi:transposase InsO family protein
MGEQEPGSASPPIRGERAGRPARKRQPPLRLQAHPRRAAQARPRCIRDDDRQHLAPQWPWPRAAAIGSHLDRIPPHTSRLHPRLRFFTAYSLWGKTLYVLFFIEISTRRVHVAGCTARPDSAWVTQQARSLSMCWEDRSRPVRFLVHDRDAKYGGGFDVVFRAEGVDIIRTPIKAPRANAFAERWVKTVKTECLDRMLIVGPRHLQAILREYVEHYNCGRPHRGLELRCPMPHPRARRPAPPASVRRRPWLGGLLSEYHEAA